MPEMILLNQVLLYSLFEVKAPRNLFGRLDKQEIINLKDVQSKR